MTQSLTITELSRAVFASADIQKGTDLISAMRGAGVPLEDTKDTIDLLLQAACEELGIPPGEDIEDSKAILWSLGHHRFSGDIQHRFEMALDRKLRETPGFLGIITVEPGRKQVSEAETHDLQHH